MNARKYMLFLLGFLTFTYVNASSISSSSAEPIITNSASTDVIVLIVTLVSGLLTILTVAVQSIRPEKDSNEVTQKTIEQLNKENIEEKIKSIQQNLNTLDIAVHHHIERKIQSLSDNYNALDKQISVFTKNLEVSLNDRKDESKQLKQELNIIRDNIREDLNDVRKLITEITLAFRISDNE